MCHPRVVEKCDFSRFLDIFDDFDRFPGSIRVVSDKLVKMCLFLLKRHVFDLPGETTHLAPGNRHFLTENGEKSSKMAHFVPFSGILAISFGTEEGFWPELPKMTLFDPKWTLKMHDFEGPFPVLSKIVHIQGVPEMRTPILHSEVQKVVEKHDFFDHFLTKMCVHHLFGQNTVNPHRYRGAEKCILGCQKGAFLGCQKVHLLVPKGCILGSKRPF